MRQEPFGFGLPKGRHAAHRRLVPGYLPVSVFRRQGFVLDAGADDIKAVEPDLAHVVDPGEEVRFASDSPLEGDGFELPVPGRETVKPSWEK